jgi:hypothetical protein
MQSEGWPMYHRVERRARRLERVMEYADVDVHALVLDRLGATFAEAFRACLTCNATAQCRAWYEQSDEDPASFCPNWTSIRRFVRNRTAEQTKSSP